VKQEQRGTVEGLEGAKATLALDDGSERVFDVPERILVEVGMAATVVDVGDGKPVFVWGD